MADTAAIHAGSTGSMIAQAQRPPALVRSSVELDATAMAQGFRLTEKDKYIIVTSSSEPRDVFEKDMIDRLGDSFCRRVIYHIACFNQADVNNFAHHFSLQFQSNPQRLVELIGRQPYQVFSPDDIAKHGLLFLKAVMSQCIHCLHQTAQWQLKQGMIKESVATESLSKQQSIPDQSKANLSLNVSRKHSILHQVENC
jgi:hypothetical protein